MFYPSELLEKSLNEYTNDSYNIVGALMGYINSDPKFKSNEFDDAVEYVLNHGVTEDELFSEFDDKIPYKENDGEWNEEYYNYARLYLKDNFCKKRINHVKNIAKKIYPVNSERQNDEHYLTTKSNVTINNNQKKAMSQQYRNPQIGIIITVAIILLAILIIVLL